MASALKKIDACEDASVGIDLDDAFAAALQRAQSLPARTQASVISMVSREEWQSMDASQDNIMVCDSD